MLMVALMLAKALNDFRYQTGLHTARENKVTVAIPYHARANAIA